MCARLVEPAAMNLDDRQREVVLRTLQRVLDGDVARRGCVHGRLLPLAGPELEPREPPQRVPAPGLVALVPLLVLTLEVRAHRLASRARRARVHDRLRRLLD